MVSSVSRTVDSTKLTRFSEGDSSDVTAGDGVFGLIAGMNMLNGLMILRRLELAAGVGANGDPAAVTGACGSITAGNGSCVVSLVRRAGGMTFTPLVVESA